jgi:transposase
MSYIPGEDRGQAALLPAVIEDYVAADAPVRVIDAFVDGLDVIGLRFGRSVPAATGRPPYDPRDLLKLYLYGYLNEVRSSRRLERECSRNVEVMWLLRRLAPDFKTIADFRRDNGAAIVGVCRAFVLFCRDQGLFTARLVALDGSRFRAAASAKRVMGRREIADETGRLDRRIAEYLADLDESDACEPDEVPSATTAALEALKMRRAELDRLAAKLDEEDRNTLVESEPDARPMGIGKGPKPPSYNVQTAVDAETGFIIHHEVTGDPNDTRQLYPMAKATKDMLGVASLTVVADAGSRGLRGGRHHGLRADQSVDTQSGRRHDVWSLGLRLSAGGGHLYLSGGSCSHPQAGDASRSSYRLCGTRLRRLLTQAALHDRRASLCQPPSA